MPEFLTVARVDDVPPGSVRTMSVGEFDRAIQLCTYEVRVEDGDVQVAV